jgi:hypothetical protein
MGSKQELRKACPPWCAMRHGIHQGEEDLVHVSTQECVRDTLLRLAATIDADTGEQDGPYLLMGSHEFSMAELDALIQALHSMRDLARQGRIPQQPEGVPARA